jgi:hypothetical protein
MKKRPPPFPKPPREPFRGPGPKHPRGTTSRPMTAATSSLAKGSRKKNTGG